MTVVVIGGGPAGMIAAAEAAGAGAQTILLEQNEKLGKKLYITGKGRCNVTNACERDGFFAAVVKNPRFLYSAFAAFDNRDLMALLERLGVPLKTERGGRVFPASDKSSDILRAMERHVRASGVQVRLHTRAIGLRIEDGAVCAVRTENGEIPCEAAIIATGGCSYPQTGSTGDGYRFAAEAGHAVEPPRGALVPLVTEETWPAALAGLTLKNVTLSAYREQKRLFQSEPGEMLFTHFGVSGPLVLTLSSLIAEEPAGVRLAIDLKPGLTQEQLDARLLRDLDANRQKQLAGALHALLPERLLLAVLEQAGVDAQKRVSELKRGERMAVRDTLKALPLTVRCARPIEEAVVTRGGVSVREVRSRDLASKRIRGLYFAGEVLDVDAVTGGYNLQIAWSTGALAGRSSVCSD
ncbi:MAG: NAD(P)/FAD-dependent oxidoreductase [bacterium]|nr:NAD(P)/FAD-dependent oxidoreductase [bacterium]